MTPASIRQGYGTLRGPLAGVTPARIAFVDHAPFVGGAETVLLDVIAHLDRSRFDPIVYLPAASPLVPLLDARAVDWRDLPMPRLNALSPLTPLRWLAAARRLARLAREQRIDLIHANTVRAHLISAFAGQTPVVWLLHDDTFPRRLFDRLRRPARLIANSLATAQHYHLENDPRTTVVHNGIDTQAAPGNRFRFRQAIGVVPDHLLVAHVGRLARWKGQRLFIEAAARVAPAFPNARFVIVGTYAEGDEARGELGGGAQYHAELRRLAASLGLDDRLTFAGHQANIADVYAGIDLLVLSSTRPEPFGRVLIEAMAAAVPVVAPAQGGPAEIVEPDVTGLLVAPGRVDALADALTSLLGDATRRARMGVAARRRAQEHFDIRQQVDRLQAIYLDVIKAARKS